MISVIVPYKNAERWLGRCCDSLESQLGDFEFVFVSDNCTDNSDEIVNKYVDKDKRFRFIWNIYQAGVSGARNTGLDVARGDWITFLDADDELLPNAYEIFIKATKTRANVCQFNHIRYKAKKDNAKVSGVNPRGMYTSVRLPAYWFGVWNKLYNSELVKDIRFDERTQYGEDGLFVLECLSKDDRIYCAGYKAITVRHNVENMESLSHVKTRDDLLNQIHIYEEFMLRQTNPSLRVAVCKEIGNLWKHKRMADAFGKGDDADG